MRVFQDEPVVKVSKFKEILHIFYRFGDFPTKNGIDFFRVHFDTVFRDNKTEERGFVDREFAFFWFDEKSGFLELLENFSYLFLVFLQGFRVYQDVVYVANTELVEVFAEYVINKPLGCSGSVGKTKGHDKEFKEAVAGSKGGFPFVACFDSNLVETST